MKWKSQCKFLQFVLLDAFKRFLPWPFTKMYFFTTLFLRASFLSFSFYYRNQHFDAESFYIPVFLVCVHFSHFLATFVLLCCFRLFFRNVYLHLHLQAKARIHIGVTHMDDCTNIKYIQDTKSRYRCRRSQVWGK